MAGPRKVYTPEFKLQAVQMITDLCREAHGGMAPDDWRFEFIHLGTQQKSDFPTFSRTNSVVTLYPYTFNSQ